MGSTARTQTHINWTLERTERLHTGRLRHINNWPRRIPAKCKEVLEEFVEETLTG